MLAKNRYSRVAQGVLLSVHFVQMIMTTLVKVTLSIDNLRVRAMFRGPLTSPCLLKMDSNTKLNMTLFVLNTPLLK